MKNCVIFFVYVVFFRIGKEGKYYILDFLVFIYLGRIGEVDVVGEGGEWRLGKSLEKGGKKYIIWKVIFTDGLRFLLNGSLYEKK